MGFKWGLTALNVISILLGLGLSISVVKNPKRRDVFSIIALCICGFWGATYGWYFNFGLNIHFYVRGAYEKYIDCRRFSCL